MSEILFIKFTIKKVIKVILSINALSQKKLFFPIQLANVNGMNEWMHEIYTILIQKVQWILI